MRCKACMKCREYVLIHPENPENQEVIKLFEGIHRGHTVVTLDFNEVKGTFKNFQEEKAEESEESSEAKD
ncbi:hypothetical protein ES703_91971 [subsurface metagenome]